ncbi:MAG TPA: Minf_1886 family protein [Gemmatimonadales bacterium]|nr:Minf_1886 family protein [Gemmatimonadales bacterium]
MNDFTTIEEAFARIRAEDGRYEERGYFFVLAALEYAQGRLPARRHLSGAELAWACRDFALEQFGLLAQTVLAYWGITSTEDLGRIVFLLIDVGLLARQDSDQIQDFSGVYDFAEAFRSGYKWPGVERA